MSQIQLKDIPFPRDSNIKEESNQLLAAAQLQSYSVDREQQFKEFSGLLQSSLSNAYRFTKQQEESLKLIEEQSKANKFLDQFTPDRVDEEMDAYAKEAGFDLRGKIYFGNNDQMVSGFMGHSAASDAGNMFSGNFELLSTSQAAFRTKMQMLGSNVLLSRSKAWPGLKKTFELTGLDKDEYLRQLTLDNNWERLTNIDSFESLARAVPVVDPLFTAISGTTPEEEYLQRKDPTFDGARIVEEIQTNDPEFAAFLKLEGVNLKDLAQAENAFHFRWLLNSTVQANAISKSVQTSEKYHSAPVNWALFGYNQAYHSLTSGDFVGQVVLTAATAGLGTAVAGLGTAINGLSAASRVEGAIAASEMAINMAKAGKAVRGIQNWLPANIPSTLVHKFTPNGLKFGKSTAGSFGVWLTGQSIEGFIEEGITDVANQIYESNIGTRIKYNYGQMLDAALMGALMEPVLGGALQAVTIPISITTAFAGKVGSSVAEGLFTYSFNLDSGRVREFSLYLDEFMGKFENLSPEEQQTRIGIITAGLATEAALNEATGNSFGKLEEERNQLLIGQVMSLISEDHRLSRDSSGRLLLSELAVKLAKLREDLAGINGQGTVRIETEETNADDVGRGYIGFEEKPKNKFLVFSRGPDLTNVVKIPYNKSMEQVFTIQDGNLVFTRNGAELLLVALAVDSQSTTETMADNVTDMMALIGRTRLVDKVKKDNPKFNKKELSEEEQEELNDIVLKIIETEGETDFTRIMDEINSSFEVIRQLDLNPKDDVTSTVDIQVDPEIAKKISMSRKQTRDRFNKQEEAEVGVPPLLARPTEEETMPPKPWSMMDEVTPVESSTTPEVATINTSFTGTTTPNKTDLKTLLSFRERKARGHFNGMTHDEAVAFHAKQSKEEKDKLIELTNNAPEGTIIEGLSGPNRADTQVKRSGIWWSHRNGKRVTSVDGTTGEGLYRSGYAMGGNIISFIYPTEVAPAAPEVAPAAPEVAPAAPEVAPAAPEVAPVITPTPTTTVLDADSIKAKLDSLDPVLLNALKNARKC